MKVNKDIRTIQPFKFKDNYNIDYTPYYVLEKGVYRFLDKFVRLECMYKFGIMCQCERVSTKDGFKYCYNGIEITERQKDFLRKRAIALSNEKILGVYYECGCKKNKGPE